MHYVSDFCIVCFSYETRLEKLSDVDSDNIKLLDKLVYCSGEQVVSNVPNSICPKCCNELKSAYNFKKKVLDSMNRLKNCLESFLNDSDENNFGGKKHAFVLHLEDSDMSCITDIEEEEEERLVIEEEEEEHQDTPRKDLQDEPVEEKKTFQLSQVSTTVKSTYECEECHKTYKYISRLERHSLEHTGIKRFTCKECLEQFTREIALNRHMFIHSKDQNPCRICSEPSCNKSNCHGSVSRGSVCSDPFSDESFTTENTGAGLQLEIYIFTCSVCQRGFKKSEELQVHMQLHDKKEELNRENLLQMILSADKAKEELSAEKTKQTSIEKYKCGEFFACDSCSSFFTTFENLKKHMKIHTRNKPFACNKCPKRYTSKYNLLHHLWRIHSTLTMVSEENVQNFPFLDDPKICENEQTSKPAKKFRPCSLCNRIYTFPVGLKNHMIWHVKQNMKKYLKNYKNTTKNAVVECEDPLRFIEENLKDPTEIPAKESEKSLKQLQNHEKKGKKPAENAAIDLQDSLKLLGANTTRQIKKPSKQLQYHLKRGKKCAQNAKIELEDFLKSTGTNLTDSTTKETEESSVKLQKKDKKSPSNATINIEGTLKPVETNSKNSSEIVARKVAESSKKLQNPRKRNRKSMQNATTQLEEPLKSLTVNLKDSTEISTKETEESTKQLQNRVKRGKESPGNDIANSEDPLKSLGAISKNSTKITTRKTEESLTKLQNHTKRRKKSAGNATLDFEDFLKFLEENSKNSIKTATKKIEKSSKQLQIKTRRKSKNDTTQLVELSKYTETNRENCNEDNRGNEESLKQMKNLQAQKKYSRPKSRRFNYRNKKIRLMTKRDNDINVDASKVIVKLAQK